MGLASVRTDGLLVRAISPSVRNPVCPSRRPVTIAFSAFQGACFATRREPGLVQHFSTRVWRGPLASTPPPRGATRPLLANAWSTSCRNLVADEFGSHTQPDTGETGKNRRRLGVSQPAGTSRRIHPPATAATQDLEGNRRTASQREKLSHYAPGRTRVLSPILETLRPATLGEGRALSRDAGFSATGNHNAT